MDTLYERIQTLCKSKGVSVSRMCLDLDMSKSTMSDMKHGRTKTLSSSNLIKIASYLGVTTDALLVDSAEPTPPAPSVDPEDLALLAKYRTADENTRAAIRLLLKL